ncbi:MAG: hypothetical protein ACLQT6_16285 [Desulfomonilaceae bacterium]
MKMVPVANMEAILEHYNHNPVLRSLVQWVIPFLGTVADIALVETYSKMLRDRMRIFFDELGSGDIPLTEDLIKSNDFLHCFMCTFHAVIRTHQQEKLELFARLLKSAANTPTYSKSGVDEYEEYLSILNELSVREWNILDVIYSFETSFPNPPNETLVQCAMRYWPRLRKELISRELTMENQVNSFLARLNRTGCYVTFTGDYLSYSGDMGRTTETYRKLRSLVVKENDSP